jgi:hypothetical protein
VLAALAEQAEVTTLVTSEGKSLTEIRLTVKNQAQPFLKVALPPGVSILSAEVAGEKVKPVQGADGARVPLLRPGFRPSGPYLVSFVFLHSGTAFLKKGGSEITLPKMDVPIEVLRWELFLPERYKVKDFGGDAISASLLPDLELSVEGAVAGDFRWAAAAPPPSNFRPDPLLPGQLGGLVVDSNGAPLANIQVTVTSVETGGTYRATTNGSGGWVVPNVPSGHVKVGAAAPGLRSAALDFSYDSSRPGQVTLPMSVGAMNETVTLSATNMTVESQKIEKDKRSPALQANAASSNVINLQRRVAGVLPVAVDVPRAGNSYRFVRPLVLDEETKVTFSYRTK